MQPFQRVEKNVSTEPEEEKAGDEVTEAEQTDPHRPRYEQDEQRQPERVIEHAQFDVV